VQRKDLLSRKLPEVVRDTKLLRRDIRNYLKSWEGETRTFLGWLFRSLYRL